MPISAGDLRHRVEIQRQVQTRNSSGEIETSWQSVDTVWAKIDPLKAYEFISAQQMNSKIVAHITIRFRPDVTAADRLVRGSTIYNITGILPDGEGGIEYLTMPCSTGFNDG